MELRGKHWETWVCTPGAIQSKGKEEKCYDKGARPQRPQVGDRMLPLLPEKSKLSVQL